ncbi:MAG TPA: hypothetical protein VKJ47_02465, partial [Candidatus Binatia bacterium]|nr:hypothetical protein [Candidatus Binatia bacterium]
MQSARAASFSGSAETAGTAVGPTTTLPEAEEHIAVNPNNAANLVAAVSDFSLRGGYNTTKYVYSTSGGASGGWRENFVPLVNGSPATRDGRTWEANSDPVVAIDKAGNVYLADLYFNDSDNANGLYVSAASLSAGVNFTAAATYAVAANPSPTTNVSEDKEWIAVDNNNGNVYVSWTRFVGSSDSILLSCSTTHGQVWSAPAQINPTSQNGAVQGSQVAVGPFGEVYVVYEVFYVGGVRRHFLAKSTSGCTTGGMIFSAPVGITPYFNELRFNSTYRKNSFASLAVSPVKPVGPANVAVYVVYADQPSNQAGAEVEFIRSTDGGSSFSPPVVLNDNSTGQQFMPAVTTDEKGAIHVSWFDTRNSSSSASYDVYATYSGTGGVSFHPNVRVTPSRVSAGSASFIGDYAGVAAAAGNAHPVWTSGGF